MFANPVQETKEAQAAAAMAEERVKYPIRICCVLRDHAQYGDELIKSIRDHTVEKGAMFMTRIYDSKKYSEDCNFIERLPALHIYKERSYIKTFYPNTRPLQHVNETVEEYLRVLESRRLKKDKWNKMFKKVLKWFKAIGKKKTRMELYEEAQEAERVRRVSDWPNY
jgi:hypothetical protein